MARTEVNYVRFVDLHITGSPVIAMMGKPLDAVAKVSPSTTWYELLEGYGMKLSPEDGVYVRTMGVNMVSSEGHDCTIRAELCDPIVEFLDKFKVKRSRHTVRLLYNNGRGFMNRPKRKPKVRNGGNSNATGAPTIVIGTGPNRIVTAPNPRTAPARIVTASDSDEIYRKPRYTPSFSRASNIGGQRFRYGTRLRSRIAQNGASTSGVGNRTTAVKAGVSKNMGARRRQIPIQQRTMNGPPAPRIEDEVVVKDEPIVDMVEIDLDESESMSMVDGMELEGNEMEVEHDNGREDGDEFDEEDGDEFDQEDGDEFDQEDGDEFDQEDGDEFDEEDGNQFAEEDGDEFAEEDGDESDEEEGDQSDEEVDNMNVYMGLMEAQGVRQEEEVTPPADLRASAQRTLDRFENSFLHKVQKEIKKLRRDNLWVRNVQRSPLGCYILQEMFKC